MYHQYFHSFKHSNHHDCLPVWQTRENELSSFGLQSCFLAMRYISSSCHFLELIDSFFPFTHTLNQNHFTPPPGHLPLRFGYIYCHLGSSALQHCPRSGRQVNSFFPAAFHHSRVSSVFFSRLLGMPRLVQVGSDKMFTQKV